MPFKHAIALAALLVASAAEANAGRGSGHYFSLFNATHDSVTALSVARSGDGDFRPVDIGAPLRGGNTATTIWLDTADGGCRQDLRVEFHDGRTLLYRDIDVCRNRQLRLRPQDGRAGDDVR
ncbi:hypothetical protein FZO89_00725 [Luteimonas viscosa]|uniref:Uncharacterized protein n=1 Tax=Luteimonas viscosa TaxID=1132694 RepID=A0A5D4XM69_9GAMM|nr:hypothetical protein [Luteimonas viscosa]TYT24921.1 hypothetical protein FZO89_00725 [Luteimonas viscosa]